MVELSLTGTAALAARDTAPDCLVPMRSLLRDDQQVTIADGGDKALDTAQELARNRRSRSGDFHDYSG